MTNLQIDKLTALLENHYNLFHTDLIFRALTDKELSVESFEQGIIEIQDSEQTDDDEFVPKMWSEV